MMSKVVRIQSNITIAVTPGLNFKDVTNPDAHIPDRLKVSAQWPKCTVLIKQGVANYPAEIVDWPTVKALAKDNIITIGETLDAVTEEDVKNVEKFHTDLENVQQNETKQRRTRKNLDELTQEV